MNEAIRDLRHEHEAILFTLGALERMAAIAGKGEAPNADDPRALLAVLKEFADTCHHGKEEGILFPALEAAGLGRDGGPIGQMLIEHELGRSHLRSMEAALLSGPDYPAFARAAGEYSSLLRRHIAKENDILFPMGERFLDDGAWKDIKRRFDEHEERVIGKGRHEELHAILDGFERRYPEGARTGNA